MNRLALFAFALNTPWLLFGQNQVIQAGTTDIIKNLNPFLAESQMELHLKDLVFPGLIANFRKAGDDASGGCGFRPLLLSNFDCNSGKNQFFLRFDLSGSDLNIKDVERNFIKIKSLGTKSNFSWNLKDVKPHETLQNQVYMHFSISNQNSKMIAASFPLVDFQAAGDWPRNDLTLDLDAHRRKLKGFSRYEYEKIDKLNAIHVLAPKSNGKGKKLKVLYFPDYAEMVNSLKDQSLHIAFNISPLTELSDDFQRAELNFAHQFVSYIRVTPKGKTKNLDNMDLIKKIRSDFFQGFYRNSLLKNETGENRSLYPKAGFFSEDSGANAGSFKASSLTKITLLYNSSTINDEFVSILERAFSTANYELEPKSVSPGLNRNALKQNKYDLILETRYVLFPEFQNLRYYLDLIRDHPQASGMRKRINNILSQSQSISEHYQDAQKLERELLELAPVIFLARFNTDIVLQPGVRNYGQSENPFFFYNLQNW